jgi:hypothetical protein
VEAKMMMMRMEMIRVMMIRHLPTTHLGRIPTNMSIEKLGERLEKRGSLSNAFRSSLNR